MMVAIDESVRSGDWLQTWTGRRFYPLDVRPEDIDATDIAHALGHVCRYGGHLVTHYSVAEHCVLMSQAVSEESAVYALLHDAAEAYIGDMVRPLKRYLPDFQMIENRILDAIAQRFGIGDKFVMPEEVLAADTRIIVDEKRVLKPNAERWSLEDHFEPLGVEIQAWNPRLAQMNWTGRLTDLVGEETVFYG